MTSRFVLTVFSTWAFGLQQESFHEIFYKEDLACIVPGLFYTRIYLNILNFICQIRCEMVLILYVQ